MGFSTASEECFFWLGAALKTAGSRPGGRGPFFLREKKGPKEARPVAPALRASLAADRRPGRPLKLAFGSDIASGLPRSASPPLGGAKGEENRWLGTVRDVEKREVAKAFSESRFQNQKRPFIVNRSLATVSRRIADRPSPRFEFPFRPIELV